MYSLCVVWFDLRYGMIGIFVLYSTSSNVCVIFVLQLRYIILWKREKLIFGRRFFAWDFLVLVESVKSIFLGGCEWEFTSFFLWLVL